MTSLRQAARQRDAIKRERIANAIEQGLKFLAPDTSWPLNAPPGDVFLCNAIGVAVRQSTLSSEDKDLACDHISDVIEHCGTFCTWLRHRHPKLSEEVHKDEAENEGRRMQITRRAWAENMIKELRAQ